MSVGRLRHKRRKYKQPCTSRILTYRVRKELCVQRASSEYFPSDGEQARGTEVSR